MDVGSRNTPRPHALVSGGGIAGLSNAIALSRVGWRCTVVERAPEPRQGGYMIDIFGMGWHAARELGVLRELRAAGHRFRELRLLDALGRTTGRVDLGTLSRSVGHAFTSVMRPDIERVLLGAVDADVRYGTTVAAMTDIDDAVEVTLSDGTDLRADLVIGADGLHSHVRRLRFGGESAFVHSLGFQVGAFVADAPQLARRLGDSVHLTDVLDRQLGVFALHSAERGRHPSHVSGFVLRRDTGELPEDAGTAVRSELAHHGDLGLALVDAVGTDVYFDQVAQARVPSWVANRVVLVGDAAHAVSLIAGQGAATAIAGALRLGAAVGQHGAVRGVIEYERTWRPVVEAVQRSGARGASAFVPSSRAAQLGRRAMLGLARLPGVTAAVGRSFGAVTH